jgi:hypothetical protein
VLWQTGQQVLKNRVNAKQHVITVAEHMMLTKFDVMNFFPGSCVEDDLLTFDRSL